MCRCLSHRGGGAERSEAEGDVWFNLIGIRSKMSGTLG
jgi:hypothetical protein